MKGKSMALIAICCSLVIGLYVSVAAKAVMSGEPEANIVRDKLVKVFPRITPGDIRKTDISGLYEVEAGENILYFYPDKEYLMFGDIWTKEGKSLTAERRQEAAAKKVKELPLAKGIKIGNGKNVVVEFTDPDCPFCRKAFDFFRNRQDVTKYVFLYPLPIHKDAASKAKYILCASDKAKAYEEIMSGKLDGKELEVSCNGEEGAGLLGEHKQLGEKAGVTGTPAFWVNERFVSGANIPLIESYLTKTN